MSASGQEKMKSMLSSLFDAAFALNMLSTLAMYSLQDASRCVQPDYGPELRARLPDARAQAARAAAARRAGAPGQLGARHGLVGRGHGEQQLRQYANAARARELLTLWPLCRRGRSAALAARWRCHHVQHVDCVVRFGVAQRLALLARREGGLQDKVIVQALQDKAIVLVARRVHFRGCSGGWPVHAPCGLASP
mgnify:CR=1 FL=1